VPRRVAYGLTPQGVGPGEGVQQHPGAPGKPRQQHVPMERAAADEEEDQQCEREDRGGRSTDRGSPRRRPARHRRHPSIAKPTPGVGRPRRLERRSKGRALQRPESPGTVPLLSSIALRVSSPRQSNASPARPPPQALRCGDRRAGTSKLSPWTGINADQAPLDTLVAATGAIEDGSRLLLLPAQDSRHATYPRGGTALARPWQDYLDTLHPPRGTRLKCANWKPSSWLPSSTAALAARPTSRSGAPKSST
jgi:hypothetical protein